MNNKFIKDNIHLEKGEAYEWYLLNTSSLYKEEFRKDSSKKELIESYLNAAKNIYEQMTISTHAYGATYVFRSDTLSIPFLFLCRHRIELSLKYYLEKNNIKFQGNHDINKLFNKSKINNDNFKQLIKAFKTLDKTGTMLRYSTDQDDNEYRNKPLFVKAEDILKTTRDLTDYILNKINNH